MFDACLDPGVVGLHKDSSAGSTNYYQFLLIFQGKKNLESFSSLLNFLIQYLSKKAVIVMHVRSMYSWHSMENIFSASWRDCHKTHPIGMSVRRNSVLCRFRCRPGYFQDLEILSEFETTWLNFKHPNQCLSHCNTWYGFCMQAGLVILILTP